ncbi:TetR/AcrR family transcriptional regulator [Nocardia yamanashiensis]|uniref:TetR/AcrR family transcriptional regulator n=1 Tax=Nocardia yamanashiensis TaxID=209247 RepID=UPI000AC76656|nr:TetR/AcrR family transcriptional regulator [Nocardia yamanashiensis]UGT42419.1 TetR/AcrR family transcriptional regulator [Nocardia yamanashiensis]
MTPEPAANPETRIDGRRLRFQHRRPELLAAATEYVLENGVRDFSLRPVAQALGVSHATLIRHFATRDALIAEVLENIRVDFERRLFTPEIRTAESAQELLRAAWRLLCQPREQRQFLVLFELVAAGAHTPAGPLARLATDWLTLIETELERYGWPAESVSSTATFVLAQVRGLQLDLLTTGDRERVDAAFELTIDLLTASAG